MKASLAVCLLLLSLLLSHVQGIHWGKGFSSAGNRKILVEEGSPIKITGNGGLAGEVTLCRDGHCSSGTMKRRFHRVAKTIHHWVPWIHEDYYGPKTHKPKHH